MNIVGTLNLGVNQKLPPLCFPQSHHPVNLFPNVFCSRPSSTPIISFNTDITQISKKILGNKSGKIRNIFSAKELLTLNILFSRKRFPPPRSKFGERIVPERTDNKRPLHISLRPWKMEPPRILLSSGPVGTFVEELSKKRLQKGKRSPLATCVKTEGVKVVPIKSFFHPRRSTALHTSLKVAWTF